MRNGIALMAALAGLLIVGCGSSSSGSTSSGSTGTTGTTAGGSTSSSTGGSGSTSGTSGSGCTIALSGAVTESDTCAEPIIVAYDSTNNNGAISITSTQTTSNISNVTFGFGINQDWATGTYDYNTASVGDMNASYNAQAQSGKTWTASNGSTPTGNISWNITSLTLQGQTQNGKSYTVHGTMDATLKPGGSATGDITVHAEF